MYRYRVTLESLSANTEAQTLQFETDNHDDIFAIVKRTQARGVLDDESAKAFAVGLKLFSEVILKNREKPPYSEMKPILGELMKIVKGGR